MPALPSAVSHASASRGRLWAGWVLSILPSLMLLTGAINAFRGAPMVVQGAEHLGYSASIVPVMGILELLCSLLYLIPATSLYGAILLTAYFGGATASHLRIGERAFIAPVLFGMVVWVGLALRDRRISDLLTKVH